MEIVEKTEINGSPCGLAEMTEIYGEKIQKQGILLFLYVNSVVFLSRQCIPEFPNNFNRWR